MGKLNLFAGVCSVKEEGILMKLVFNLKRTHCMVSSLDVMHVRVKYIYLKRLSRYLDDAVVVKKLVYLISTGIFKFNYNT